MNKTNRTLVTLVFVAAASLLASALMQKFSPNNSWLAFVGWAIFFASIQVPILMATQSSQTVQGSCTAWLTRFQNKE